MDAASKVDREISKEAENRQVYHQEDGVSASQNPSSLIGGSDSNYYSLDLSSGVTSMESATPLISPAAGPSSSDHRCSERQALAASGQSTYPTVAMQQHFTNSHFQRKWSEQRNPDQELLLAELPLESFSSASQFSLVTRAQTARTSKQFPDLCGGLSVHSPLPRPHPC